MNIEIVDIESILPDPANARKHGDRNIAAIKSSLARFGQQKPIVVDTRNVVRAGNGTLGAAKALGWKQIAVVRSDLPSSELAAFAVADNRTAELAEWDKSVLTNLFNDVNLGDVGFSNAEIEKLLGNHSEGDEKSPKESEIDESYEVVIACKDEQEQKRLFKRLNGEGYSCRLFTL